MKLRPLVRLAAIAIVVPGLLLAATRDWRDGKVIDSRIAKSSTPVGAVTNTTGTTTGTVTGNATAATIGNTTTATGTAYGSSTSQSTSNTQVLFANIRDNQLVILGDEFGYVVEDTKVSGGGGGLVGITVHAIANRKHGCHFIVGDNVRYAQEKATLYVLDADNKECSTEILRQERLRPVAQISKQPVQVWKSVLGPERFKIQADGDFIYAERIVMAEQIAAGVFSQKVELRKSGNLYVGKARENGSCAYSARLKSHSCATEEEIEITLVTPTRIEGAILAPPAGAKFDCKKCQYSQPKQIQKFAWIPE